MNFEVLGELHLSNQISYATNQGISGISGNKC